MNKYENEVWKDIIGYEGYYQVSNMGRIKSLARNIYNKKGNFQRFKKETIKALKVNTDGYHAITLSVNCNDKTIGVHRLVAQAFIPNPENLLEVNHLDCNRKNNNVENLEWCTHQENIDYTIESGNHYIANFDRTGKNNPNYGNTKLKERFRDNPELKQLLARPVKQNGRARMVHMFKDNLELEFGYIGECANWFKENFDISYKERTVFENLKKCNKNNTLYYGYKIIIE